jgi:hypothetical protein
MRHRRTLHHGHAVPRASGNHENAGRGAQHKKTTSALVTRYLQEDARSCQEPAAIRGHSILGLFSVIVHFY